jgi:OOP family OmpA-OmpF porin
MKPSRRSVVALTAVLCILCAGLAYGASDGKKVKITGLITARDGENFTMKTVKGAAKVVVALTDDTKVQSPVGVFRHSEQSVTALVPGLQVSVEGTGTDSRVVAKTITFNKQNLLLAETIQAGLNPTQQQQAANTSNIAANKEDISTNQQDIAANTVQTAANREQIEANQEQIAGNQQEIQATTQRFNELSEYDTTAKATVYFASGSYNISDSDKAALSVLATTAVGTKGYIIQVKGFADSSGNAAMNQQLSMDRAQAVVAYLLQNCNVPLRHIVAPGAMGIADPAAPNETADGRADNRRVDVKVLVNRGVAGGM